MKDRKDWGPADEIANAQMIASGIFIGVLVLGNLIYWPLHWLGIL